MPTISLRPGEWQRLRIINAAAARVFRLAIPGQKLVHVGSDGGLFEKPREVDELLLANSERVEVLVRGGSPGSRAVAANASVRSLRFSDAAERLGATARSRRTSNVHGSPAPTYTIPSAFVSSVPLVRSSWPLAAPSCSLRE
jgi:bilirubin oxidase